TFLLSIRSVTRVIPPRVVMSGGRPPATAAASLAVMSDSGTVSSSTSTSGCSAVNRALTRVRWSACAPVRWYHRRRGARPAGARGAPPARPPAAGGAPRPAGGQPRGRSPGAAGEQSPPAQPGRRASTSEVTPPEHRLTPLHPIRHAGPPRAP